MQNKNGFVLGAGSGSRGSKRKQESRTTRYCGLTSMAMAAVAATQPRETVCASLFIEVMAYCYSVCYSASFDRCCLVLDANRTHDSRTARCLFVCALVGARATSIRFASATQFPIVRALLLSILLFLPHPRPPGLHRSSIHWFR